MIPTYDEVMLPLLKVVSNKEVYTNKEVEEALSKYFNLTDEEKHKELKSGVKIFYDRISWAKTYLKNSKLIEVPKRGTFRISPLGLILCIKRRDLVLKMLLFIILMSFILF